MSDKADLKGKKVLFVAYFYPPAAGTGLPGAMRPVKFIRNMTNGEMHVLTTKPDCYPKEMKLDYQVSLPVNGEIIYRCRTMDVFGKLLKIRRYLKTMMGKGDQFAESNSGSVFKTMDETFELDKQGFFQLIKDFIHDLCYFPDQANPWILNAVIEGRRIVHRQKIDIVFATGSPWSALVTGYFISLLTQKPLIVDFRDPWVNNPFQHSKGRFLDWLSQWFERRIVHHAAVVSLNTDALKKEFNDRYPTLPARKFIVLPNGYDAIDFSWFFETNESKSILNELVLCHAGFLYGLRDPSPLFDALILCRNRLKGTGRQIRFVQIGQVSIGYDLNDKYGDLIADNTIKLIDQMPYVQCLKKLASSDILVNIQPETRTQIPSKLYDYLALNLPILNLTPRDGALGLLVLEHHFGDVFESGESVAIADRLLELLLQKEQGTLQVNYNLRSKFEIRMITKSLVNQFLSVV